MAEHIRGPLYYERAGRSGPVLAFIHPNPMDQSCWIFQMAHFSTWYRCIAIDLPGYGRSPKADPGLTCKDMAEACWEAIEEAFPGEPAILLGCSVGALLVLYMHNLRPTQTKALIACGVGYVPDKEFARRRISSFKELGVEFRWEFVFQDFCAAFRQTPLAHYFANLFTERNRYADVETIIRLFEAILMPEPEEHYSDIKCPMIILTGTEDSVHQSAFDLKAKISGCEIKVLPGAGHACQMEQPWLFDRLMIEFLEKHRLFPAEPMPAG
jgi:pimeloyl-ACP methyl ester carboxylesterase